MCLKFISARFYSSSSKRWKHRLHVYSYANKWNSLEKFSQALVENVLFNEDGLVVVNKPYGVGTQAPLKTDKELPPAVEEALNFAATGGANFYLSEVLPHLSRALGYSDLTIVKAPERYTSGVTILSANEDVTSRVRKSNKKSVDQQQLCNSYLALVLGCPQPQALSQNAGLKLEINPLDGSKRPVIVTTWTRAATLRKEVLPFKVEYKTLQQSQLASLVEVRPSMTKWHFLRIYMAYLLSPVLGDNLYGSRVQTVLGVPVSVSPFSDTAKQSQRLSKEVLAALALRAREEVIIPTHLHLHQVTLLDFKGKGMHLQIQAPLPEAFLWTCKQLRLHESQQLQALFGS